MFNALFLLLVFHFPCVRNVFPSLWERDQGRKFVMAQRVAGNLVFDASCGLSFCLSGVSSKKKKELDREDLGKWGQHDVWFGYPYWWFLNCLGERLSMASRWVSIEQFFSFFHFPGFVSCSCCFEKGALRGKQHNGDNQFYKILCYNDLCTFRMWW